MANQLSVEGTIKQVFEPREIPGKDKTWLKQDFLIEIPGTKFSKTLLVEIWGEDKINKYDLQPGLKVTAHLDLESKERNGKWFTHAQAWKITWDASQRKWN